MINKIFLPTQQKNGFLNPESKKVTTREQAFEGFNKMKQQRYDDVMAHEQAHLSAAGHLAASGIHLDYGANGVVTGGHVMIRVPEAGSADMPEDKLKQIISDARIARQAADAPSSLGGDAGELSGADKRIIAKASRVESTTKLALQECQCKSCNSCNGVGNKLNISG